MKARIVQQFISRDFQTQFFQMKKRDDDFLFFGQDVNFNFDSSKISSLGKSLARQDQVV